MRMSDFRSKTAERTHIYKDFLIYHLFVCLFSKSPSTVFSHYHWALMFFFNMHYELAMSTAECWHNENIFETEMFFLQLELAVKAGGLYRLTERKCYA